MRDLAWLDEHVAAGADVEVADRSEDLAVLGVMGPRSRELLARLTDADLGDEAFPFATGRAVEVAGAEVRANRMTYVGELGWELLVPYDAAVAVLDALHEQGADLGLADAGYSAIESLRLEKGFRAFGRELTPDYTPVEAGLVFATALAGDKDFLGRDALVARRERLRWAARAGGWSRSSSATRTRCSGVASSCCAPASRSARSPARRTAPPSARASASPTCAATSP